MASVNIVIKGTKNPSTLYLRFVCGREIDISSRLRIFINPNHWDKKNQRLKNLMEIRNRDSLNKKLVLLKLHVIDMYNDDFVGGEIIDKYWLNKIVSEFFDRPKQNKNNRNINHLVYYSDFADWWIKEKAPYWLTEKNTYLTDKAKNKYESFIDKVKAFEGKDKIKFKTLTNETISDFVNYLNDDSYASATIKRLIGRFKFFCSRAEEEGVIFGKSYKRRVFVPESEEVKAPYLSPEEIEKIYKHDFSKSERLDNVRDNLIIACWTGLRVSDFLGQLDLSNFIDDEIYIKTMKTKTPVVIPVHPMIKKILIKRNGQLPPKISDTKFNEYVKEVCKKVGLKEEMKGRLYDVKKKRKVTGMYAKHKLISSHIGRRSMSTNLVGKIEDNVIMAICGWSTKEMMYSYIKTTNREYSDRLKEYWEKTYK